MFSNVKVNALYEKALRILFDVKYRQSESCWKKITLFQFIIETYKS